jgi:hypothetical protein
VRDPSRMTEDTAGRPHATSGLGEALDVVAALRLAPVEGALDQRHADHEDDEERHHAEAEEGDGFVVGLAEETLAVFGECHRGGDEHGRQGSDEKEGSALHGRECIAPGSVGSRDVKP